jgi:hypothetical protein
VKLCAECQVDPWRYDAEGRVIGKCPQCFPTTLYGTPDAERDAALTGTAEANPAAMRAALRIIRDAALSMPQFSSNDTRHAMTVARVPGPTIGAAFRQAAKDRVIRRIGYVTSTDPGTHAHPVVEWESLIVRGAEGRTA